MKNRRLLLSALLCVSLGACVVAPAAPLRAAVEIDVGPPPPRAVEAPPPRRGYVWAPGYWRWNGRSHVWTEGRWMRERPGWRWEPPHWEERRGRWHFEPGHWER